jgi:5-methyltetrahydrofolate--homocysteine methyltransferase
MMSNSFDELMQSQTYIFLDGAMGTLLFAMGLEEGAAPELWNVTHPQRIQEVHKQYIEAGSQIILTNSFGGTHYRLKLHDLQDRVYELNKAAAENARAAAANAPHKVAVAGSMGPTGELLQPMGTMTFQQAKEAFKEQARGLIDGGVDVLWIETMSHLDEVKAAIEGAREAAGDKPVPIVATMSFDTNGRTMMGVTGTEAIKALQDYGLAAMGANCGHNLPDTMAAVQAMHQVDGSMPLVAKANAGIPQWGEEGQLVYDGTPEVMAGYAYHVQQKGAKLIGACCGSSPDTIRAMRAALSGEIAVADLPLPQKEAAQEEADSAQARAGTAGKPKRRRRRRDK